MMKAGGLYHFTRWVSHLPAATYVHQQAVVGVVILLAAVDDVDTGLFKTRLLG